MIQKRNNRSDKIDDMPPYQRPHDSNQESNLHLPGDPGETLAVNQSSLRSKRKVFVWSISAFMTGVLLILFASPYRSEFLAPGPLASPHAQILSAEGSDRCNACHAQGSQSVSQWISVAIFGASENHPTQSTLCLECHQKQFKSETALKPHNLTDSELKRRQEAASDSSRGPFQSVSFSKTMTQGDVTCNTCHREHHGDDDLTAMTNQQCQTCHQNVFTSFEIDHPEFQNPVSDRRSQIAFDHVSHLTKHFPDQKAKFNCNHCHLDDPNRNAKVLAGFDQSCAQCHDASIQESTQNGFTLLALPMLDMEAIEQQQHSIGTWPLAATGDFDGPLPPLTRALLASDPKLTQLIDDLPTTFDFSDIDRDNPNSVEQAVKLVWGIKRLLIDLAVNGESAIQRRLDHSLGLRVTKAELRRILPEREQLVFIQIVQRWLPNLENEISPEEISEDSVARTGFDLNQIRIDSANQYPSQDEIVAAIVATQEPSKADDELLAVNPLASLMSGQSKTDAEPQPQAAVIPSPLVEAVDSSDETAALPPTVGHEADDPNEDAPPVISSLTGLADTSTFRGWIRDDQTFRLTYRPQGHGDQTLAQWMDWIAASSETTTRPTLRPLYDRFVGLESVGDCRKCHTMDRFELAKVSNEPSYSSQFQTASLTMRRVSSEDSALDLPARIVHWKSKRRDPSIKQINKFSHAPHLTIPTLQDCQHCHAIDETKNNRDTFSGDDPTVFISNFRALKKADCASCHRPGGAGNDCTQCHHYHIDHGAN